MLCACLRGLANGAPTNPGTGAWLEPTIEHLRIEVDLPWPLDRLRLGVHAHVFEQFPPLADRFEDATASQDLANVDFLDRAVGECKAKPGALHRLDGIDLDQLAHLNGATGSVGCWALAECNWLLATRSVPACHELIPVLLGPLAYQSVPSAPDGVLPPQLPRRYPRRTCRYRDWFVSARSRSNGQQPWS